MLRILELPHSGVGPAPQVADVVGDAGEHPRRIRVEDVARRDVFASEPEQVAEDPELQLSLRAVAVDDRADSVPARHVEGRDAAGHPTAEVVEDVQVRAVRLDRVEQPGERGVGLLAQPETYQRAHRVGGIPDPREAVVPVLSAVQALGERGGSRSRDGAGRRVHEQFENEGTALDVSGPAPFETEGP